MAITFASSTITVTAGTDTGTATSGTSTSLTNTGKSWTTNAYANRYVWIHTGTGNGAIGYIVSNTATVLTVTQGFWKTNFTTIALEQVTPDNTSQYVIGYNMDDILAAELAAGADWGIAQQSTNQFYFTSKLIIGDGSTKTHFCDFAKKLEFSSSLTTVEFRTRVGARTSFGHHKRFNRGVDFVFLRAVNDGDGSQTYWNVEGDCDFFGNTVLRGTPASDTDINAGGSLIAASTAKITVFGGEGSCVSLDKWGQWRVQSTSLAVDGLKKTQGAGFGLLAVYPAMSRFSVCDGSNVGASGSSFVSPTSPYTLNAPVFLRNANADMQINGGHTVNMINPTWAGTVILGGSPTGTLNEQWSYDLTIASSLTGVRVYCKTSTGTEVFNTTTSSGVLAQQIVTSRQWLNSASVTSTYGPHEIRVRKYGYVPQVETTTFNAKVQTSKTMLTNAYVVASDATATAYTGITISGSGKTITLGSAHTVQEVYDYGQAFADDSAQIQYDEPITTSDGSNFVVPSAWVLYPVSYMSMGGKRLAGAGKVSYSVPAAYTHSFGTIGLQFTVASATHYDFGASDFTGTVTLTNTSGGNVFVDLPAGTSYTNTGPNITVGTPAVERGLEFTGLVAGSNVKVYTTGTATELFSTTNSGTTETFDDATSGTITVDYVIQKAGYLPLRVTGVVLTGAVGTGVIATPIQQVVDRAYVASSGLTFTTNCTITPGTKIVTWSVATTGQNLYSFMIESWIAQSSLANVEFPFKANGPSSFTFDNGWESRGFTTAGTGIANTSLNLLSRDGIRYLNTSHVLTASWAALLSVGAPAGTQVRYQQTDGGTTVNALNTGNIDQIVHIYGDATHGNFDYTNYLVCKLQEAGYDQVEVDVVTQYGSLEDQLYVIALTPTANGIATGDPALTLTVTDHGASPVTWNGKVFSLTIVDNATPSSGTNIMRELRHNFEAGGTYQGKDAFNWHDLVQVNGADFKTVRGIIYGDTGATLKGVRVVQNDGTSAHPDFTLFTADDGTTYAPPIVANISITGMPDATGASNRLQVINGTAVVASIWQATTAYAVGALRLRTTGTGTESTAGLYMRCTTAGTSAGTEPTWNTTVGGTTSDGTVTWTTYAILYYDADPTSTSLLASYVDGEEFLSGETVEIRFAEMDAGTSFKRYHSTTLAASTGFTFVVAAEADDVYATNALDGSSYETTFSPNYTSSYIVLDTNTDFTGTSAYAYFCYVLTASFGMYLFWDGITALDTGNYRIETDSFSMYFDETAGFVKQTDSVRIFRKDGLRPALDPTTGGNGIEINWRVPVNVVSTGGSALTPTESSHLLALSNAPTVTEVRTEMDDNSVKLKSIIGEL